MRGQISYSGKNRFKRCMKHYPPQKPRGPQSQRRIPAFHPVPVLPRLDGRTPQRQAEFIGYLAQTGSVMAAARAVSMGRESAYRLRKRHGAAGFAAAWDAALGKPHAPVDLSSAKSTGLLACYWLEQGRWKVVMSDGKFIGTRCIPDNDALLQQVAQLDRSRFGGVQVTRFARYLTSPNSSVLPGDQRA